MLVLKNLDWSTIRIENVELVSAPGIFSFWVSTDTPCCESQSPPPNPSWDNLQFIFAYFISLFKILKALF